MLGAIHLAVITLLHISYNCGDQGSVGLHSFAMEVHGQRPDNGIGSL